MPAEMATVAEAAADSALSFLVPEQTSSVTG